MAFSLYDATVANYLQILGAVGASLEKKRLRDKEKAHLIDLKAEKVGNGSDGQTPHIDNFLECMASRQKPIADIETGHHSTNTCHLGNIAYKVGRKLEWDEATETFKDDREANALLTREPRRGFELPKV